MGSITKVYGWLASVMAGNKLRMDVIDGTPSSLTLASAGVILHRALHLKNVMHMGVQIPSQAADGVQLVHVNTTSIGIIQVVAYVKIDNLTEHQAVRPMPNGEHLHHAAFHANGGLRDTRRFDLDTRGGRQAGQGKFIDVRRILTRGEVHLLGERIVHHVDHKILRILNISHRIFLTPSTSSRGKRQGRRIVAHRHEKTKWCEIGHRLCTDARNPGNRPWDNAPDEQFIDGLSFHHLWVKLHVVVSLSVSSAPDSALVSHVSPTAGNSSSWSQGHAVCQCHTNEGHGAANGITLAPSTPQQKHFTIPLHTVPGAHYPLENVTTWSMPCHGICLL